MMKGAQVETQPGRSTTPTTSPANVIRFNAFRLKTFFPSLRGTIQPDSQASEHPVTTLRASNFRLIKEPRRRKKAGYPATARNSIVAVDAARAAHGKIRGTGSSPDSMISTPSTLGSGLLAAL